VGEVGELMVEEEGVTEEQREIEEKIAQLRLGLLAPDPVFHPPADEREGHGASSSGPSSTPVAQKKTGSRLPFFQKLRKQKI